MIFSLNIWRSILTVECYLITLVGLSAVVGDCMVNHTKKHVYRALFDNATHGIVGGLSWLIVCLKNRDRDAANTLLEVILCTAVSSLIDLDHFCMAKSLALKDATNLKNRPALHCTTIPLIITTVALSISYLFQLHSLQRYSLLIFTAFLTHHTRDATRRGFWFHPFGSTPPIPYFVYVLMTMLIPYLVYAILYSSKTKRSVILTLEV